MSFEKNVHAKAAELAKLAVRMTTAAGSGHPSSALSLAHLVTVLLYDQMRWDPENPWSSSDDRLVLSEGHAVPIVYAAYTDLGGLIGTERETARAMTPADAMALRAIDSAIDGHPNPGLGFPFFDTATGSLGQGLSAAAGLGLAARLDGSDRRIYCIIGDGEAREGQIGEAIDFIVDYGLTNVVPIFNCNALGQSDWVSPQQSPEVLTRKLEAYGCFVRLIDGHEPNDIRKALQEVNVVCNGKRPLAIVARTVKGWGADAEQGVGKHGTPVEQADLEAVVAELERSAVELAGGALSSDGEMRPVAAARPERDQTARPVIKLPPFAEGMATVGLDASIRSGKPIATRKAYGAALCALGAADERIIALDADVRDSTYSTWFAERFQERFIECRIAEQNMISVAAGLAAAGKIPFCSTFAKFVTRAYDQVEMAIITGANIKITGSHAGVTLAADGPSQMALADVAFFRAFCHARNYDGQPAVRSFFPSDAVSCYRTTELMARLDGCCYQRTMRADLPLLYAHDDTDFRVGGTKVLREGGDVALVASGYMVHECLRAADMLSDAGCAATVIDAYSFPLEVEPLLEVAERSGGRIVTVEDNYTGGLDAEIAPGACAAGLSFENLFVTRLPKSARRPGQVLEYVGLPVEKIVQVALGKRR